MCQCVIDPQVFFVIFIQKQLEYFHLSLNNDNGSIKQHMATWGWLEIFTFYRFSSQSCSFTQSLSVVSEQVLKFRLKCLCHFKLNISTCQRVFGPQVFFENFIQKHLEYFHWFLNNDNGTTKQNMTTCDWLKVFTLYKYLTNVFLY